MSAEGGDPGCVGAYGCGVGRLVVGDGCKFGVCVVYWYIECIG